MFKDLPEGQTHSYHDGCGEPAHNSKPAQEGWRERFDDRFPSPDGHDYIGNERLSSLRNFIATEITAAEQRGAEMEMERIRNWAIANGITDKKSFRALLNFLDNTK